MFKLLVEGKVDTVVVPQGALKMDLGIHWLVLARKFIQIKDRYRSKQLLRRLSELANVIGAKYYHDQEGYQNPYAFVQSVRAQAPGGRGFSFDAKVLSAQEVLDWLVDRLGKQIIDKAKEFSGGHPNQKFSKKLTPKDLLPVQIILPQEQDYPGRLDVQPEEFKPREEPKPVDVKAGRRALVLAFYKAFTQKPSSEVSQSEDFITDYLLTRIPRAETFEKARMYYIPHQVRERFQKAGQRIYALPRETTADGNYDAVQNIGYVFIGGQDAQTVSAMFEEIFHSTGRHKISTAEGSEDVCGLEDNKGNGEFFEEGLAGIAFSQFCQEHNLDNPITQSGIMSVLCSKALSIIFSRLGERADECMQALMSGRIGDNQALEEAKRLVDTHFRDGFFQYLYTLELKEQDLMNLFSYLGYDLQFTSQ